MEKYPAQGRERPALSIGRWIMLLANPSMKTISRPSVVHAGNWACSSGNNLSWFAGEPHVSRQIRHVQPPIRALILRKASRLPCGEKQPNALCDISPSCFANSRRSPVSTEINVTPLPGSRLALPDGLTRSIFHLETDPGASRLQCDHRGRWQRRIGWLLSSNMLH